MKRIPWNKGKKGVYSQETLAKMKLAKKGKKLSEEHKNNLRGRKMTPENKAIAIKNLKPRPKGFIGYWKGKNPTHAKGDNNWQWKGGVSKDKTYVSWLKNQYHTRKRKAEGSHTWGEWENLKKQYGFKCPMCLRKEPEIKLTEDHVIPLSKGGSNYIENIQPLCGSCNCKKSSKLIGKVQVTDIN